MVQGQFSNVMPSRSLGSCQHVRSVVLVKAFVQTRAGCGAGGHFSADLVSAEGSSPVALEESAQGGVRTVTGIIVASRSGSCTLSVYVRTADQQ